MANSPLVRGRQLLLAAVTPLTTLVLIVSALFLLVASLPTDAADVAAGADTSRADALRSALSLDRPVLLRLFAWWSAVLHGDFGASWTSSRPALEVVGDAAVLTAAVAVPVLVGAALLGTMLAVATAWWKHRTVGQVLSAVVGTTIGVPEAVWVVACVTGVVLLDLNIPTVSLLAPGDTLWDDPAVMVLPVVVLLVPAGGWTARMLRGIADDVVARDVVRSARRRGVPTPRIVRALVLPSVVRAGLPIYAMIGLGVLSGSVVVEALLAYPGLGSVLVSSTGTRDIPVVMAALTATTAIAVILLTLARLGQRDSTPESVRAS